MSSNDDGRDAGGRRPAHGHGWKSELIELISTNGRIGAKKLKVVSNRTQDKREAVLFLSVRTLIELGFRIRHVTDLGARSLLDGASNAALARVILLSDGNANVGETTETIEIVRLCAEAAEHGVST
ncbi:hypothetical protein [Niveibacterium sp. SC-1]|uniref:hypothetical protein n=1 Tax=Niveibacterium sp. SC-1 TaxID=3135646 RepID=UPI00311EA291